MFQDESRFDVHDERWARTYPMYWFLRPEMESYIPKYPFFRIVFVDSICFANRGF